MEARIELLQKQCDALFQKRQGLHTLWQEIAENFYPERADFTRKRYLGEEFAAGMMTGYPFMVRRDLGNSFSAMLRPSGKQWFSATTNHAERLDTAGKQWLEYASKVQRRAMYARPTQFLRATKEGDHDFAAFGQCVLSAQLNRNADDLLYRCWHLRDVAWAENVEGKIDTVFRKWKPTARDLVKMFPKTVSKQLQDRATKEPFSEVECCHGVVPADSYEGPNKIRAPFVSVYWSCEDHTILAEEPSATLIYVVPRWQTVSGSQYAYSAAVVAALADGRLLQSMTYTLLQAGEKYVNPPMLAVQEAIRGDVNILAGGMTWVDAEYDERLGEVLRPLTQDKGGMPLGFEFQKDLREMLKEAFFLNKLNLPAPQEGMTAYEVSQRVTEYIRQALPLFEPMETDYNGWICQDTFDILLRAGAFGPLQDIPESLRGADIQFEFQSPLQEAIDADKGTKLQQGIALTGQAVTLDPSAAGILDAKQALRDALEGIGAPAQWLRSEQDVDAMAQQAAQKQQLDEALGKIQQGGAIAEQYGKASQALGVT